MLSSGWWKYVLIKAFPGEPILVMACIIDLKHLACKSNDLTYIALWVKGI